MIRESWMNGWERRCLSTKGAFAPVRLPDDAMLSEPRGPQSLGGANTGWYAGWDYEYRKVFTLPQEETMAGNETDDPKRQAGSKAMAPKESRILCFDGVYHRAQVFVNGKLAAERPNGYVPFSVDLGPYLQAGENEVRVIAKNADQPNSRWYTGTGIYRPVYLLRGAAEHLIPGALQVRTVSEKKRWIEVSAAATAAGTVRLRVLDGEGELMAEKEIALTAASSSSASSSSSAFSADSTSSAADVLAAGPGSSSSSPRFAGTVRMSVPEAELWDVEHPVLYTLVAELVSDTAVVDTDSLRFGIRSLHWDAERGLQLNGRRCLLLGGCIHHDNGLLGARTYAEAERRRVRILKACGYNAIRMAHNPCSRELLDACDEEGMLVMDELTDSWTMHKTPFDYVCDFQKWWQADLAAMVQKDFSHPCVVLYSTGNEVAETARKEGIELTGQMTEFLHRLDPTRPVTCGINIFFNFLSSMGLGVYSDEKAQADLQAQRQAAESAAAGKKKSAPVGSEFYNTLATVMGDKFMKFGATLPPSDWKTREAFTQMDIAGYNYGIWRYRHDLKKYPQRLILGTETFCKDAALFYDIARENPRILGDFVWSAWEYLGETGPGAAEFDDYRGEESETVTGDNGRIDLLGKPRAEARYTQVVFEQDPGPFIAVQPVYEDKVPAITGWKLTKALESWNYPGCEGRKARIEVFARAHRVRLCLNGREIGTRRVQGCRVQFSCPWEAGELTAVSLDEQGREIARRSLSSGSGEPRLCIETEENTGNLRFVHLTFKDGDGLWTPQERHQLRVEVTGGELLGLGSAAPYKKGNYTDDHTETYFGEAMAVVLLLEEAEAPGQIRVYVDGAKEPVIGEI